METITKACRNCGADFTYTKRPGGQPQLCRPNCPKPPVTTAVSCARCSDIFLSIHTGKPAQYCSEECENPTGRLLTCARCGVGFHWVIARGGVPKYCPAAECQRPTVRQLTCTKCGQPFTWRIQPGRVPQRCKEEICASKTKERRTCRHCGDTFIWLVAPGRKPNYCDAPRRCAVLAADRLKAERTLARLEAKTVLLTPKEAARKQELTALLSAPKEHRCTTCRHRFNPRIIGQKECFRCAPGYSRIYSPRVPKSRLVNPDAETPLS